MTPKPADAEAVLTPPKAASILGIDMAMICGHARRAEQYRLPRDETPPPGGTLR
jgi:hypothetical protein